MRAAGDQAGPPAEPVNLVGSVDGMRHAPEIIEVDSPRLEEVLGRAEQTLTQEDVKLIRAVVEAYRYVVDLVEDKNTSIGRLRQLLFGARTEKTNAVLGRKTDRRDAPSSERRRGRHRVGGRRSGPRGVEGNGPGASPQRSRAQRRRCLPRYRADPGLRFF